MPKYWNIALNVFIKWVKLFVIKPTEPCHQAPNQARSCKVLKVFRTHTLAPSPCYQAQSTNYTWPPARPSSPSGAPTLVPDAVDLLALSPVGQLVGRNRKLLRGGSCFEGVPKSASAVRSISARRIPCAGSERFGTRAGAAGARASACGHGVRSWLTEELWDAFSQRGIAREQIGRRMRHKLPIQIRGRC
jgi:hypothetical protein